MNELKTLLNKGVIDLMQYDTYVLFQLNEVGRKYLNNMMAFILTEEVEPKTGESFAWHDGRRSWWRDTKKTVNLVEHYIHKELVNDATTGSGDSAKSKRRK